MDLCPNEVWLEILLQADSESVCKFSRTCWRAKDLVDSNVGRLSHPVIDLSIDYLDPYECFFTVSDYDDMDLDWMQFQGYEADLFGFVRMIKYCELSIEFHASYDSIWNFCSLLGSCEHDMILAVFSSHGFKFKIDRVPQAERSTELALLSVAADGFCRKGFRPVHGNPVLNFYELKYTTASFGAPRELAVSVSDIVAFLQELVKSPRSSLEICLAGRLEPSALPFYVFSERLLSLASDRGLPKIYEIEKLDDCVKFTSLITRCPYWVGVKDFYEVEQIDSVALSNSNSFSLPFYHECDGFEYDDF